MTQNYPISGASTQGTKCLGQTPMPSSFSRFSGFSICHPIYHENTMLLATRHVIYSAAVSTEETTTFMLLPSWSINTSTNSYASLCRKYPHMCKFVTIPSIQLQYMKVKKKKKKKGKKKKIRATVLSGSLNFCRVWRPVLVMHGYQETSLAVSSSRGPREGCLRQRALRVTHGPLWSSLTCCRRAMVFNFLGSALGSPSSLPSSPLFSWPLGGSAAAVAWQ